MKKTLRELAELIEGCVIGNADGWIEGITGIDEAGSTDLTFAVPPHLDRAAASKAAAVIIPAYIDSYAKPAIRVENPRVAFTRLLTFFNPSPREECGIHPMAVVGKNVVLGEGVSIMAYSYIGDDVTIGANTILYPHTFVGNGSSLGSDCLIHPNVTLRERTVMGNRVIIQSGAVLGGDGFGFVTVEGEHLKVPQVGNVVIEDDVEIGANTTIDRATTASTIVKRGTKIDNLVHIAHNDIVGEHCFLAAQTGISGSVTIGNHVTLAGQTGTAGHIHIGANSVFIGRAGITKDTPENYFGAGVPARPHQEWVREQVAVHKLPAALKKIRDLEKRLEEVEKSGRNE
ncbi:MAG: UDP-3-O-(3-hydroxymyristoyl) glucosamine N-acyltransferase [Firmicutes bacterium]|nr:UDP-3-O-(3-hydroxymyristoyl) glucosamine N-acyltransferase [Bacillota bacterium]